MTSVLQHTVLMTYSQKVSGQQREAVSGREYYKLPAFILNFYLKINWLSLDCTLSNVSVDDWNHSQLYLFIYNATRQLVDLAACLN